VCISPYTIQDLRDLCKGVGIDEKGTRKEVIERLVKHASIAPTVDTVQR
jgi:hypothetical protein